MKSDYFYMIAAFIIGSLKIAMTMGCLMLDVEGTSLTKDEIEMLQHPLVGGIILFSRNFQNQQQIQALCKSIRDTAPQPILIAVDHEGGRVQRFYDAFTILPPAGIFQYLEIPEQDRLDLIQSTGWIMAAELITSGIDISFAPVLDLNIQVSKVIGDRSFSSDPEQIVAYASAFIRGMNEAGMAATGKHFPGHGSTVADSHFEMPVDNRPLQQIRELDMSVFTHMCEQGLSAIMPAHVIYSDVDSVPACFSSFWLQNILRDEIGFAGAVFTDDLSMEGAKVIGDITERASRALSAGCDMALCCNNREMAIQLLDTISLKKDPEKQKRIQTMISKPADYDFKQLQSQVKWQHIQYKLKQLEKISCNS